MERMCAKTPSVEVRGQLASVEFLPLCNSGNGTQNIGLGSCAGQFYANLAQAKIT